MRISNVPNIEYKKSFLCRLGLHTKPIIKTAATPLVFCLRCNKLLEPHLRTDLRFKINTILLSVGIILAISILTLLLIIGICHL
jgi:hypothetical protein